MVNFHGSHCRKRSFPTKCPKCKASVLFWECFHGVKVFFEYPIYGKPIKHLCTHIGRSKKRNQIVITRAEHAQKELNLVSYQCPVCNKIFSTENSLSIHINQLKKQDDSHAKFFNKNLELIDFDTDVPDPAEILAETKKIDLRKEKFDLFDQSYDLKQYRKDHNLQSYNSNFYILKEKKKK